MLYIKRLRPLLDSMPLPRKALCRRSKSRIGATRSCPEHAIVLASACADCDLHHCRGSRSDVLDARRRTHRTSESRRGNERRAVAFAGVDMSAGEAFMDDVRKGQGSTHIDKTEF